MILYSYNECINKFGSKYLVKKTVSDGIIFKLEKGIYSDTKYVSEKNIISKKYPDAIYTMESAFYYHNLSDVIPEKYYLATDRDAAKIKDNRIVQIFEKKDLLCMGAITLDYEGYPIRIYNKERLLVELLRHKSKIPFDYYKEVLLNFREIIYDLDIRTIQEYAEKVPKSTKIMQTLQLEVL